MIRIVADTNREIPNRLRNAACSIWVFLALATLPALGQHIQELSYNNLYWAAQDVNSNIFGLVPPLAAFSTTPNNQLHLYYPGFPDHHIHQLFFNGVSWGDSDLSVLSGGPTSTGNPTGFSVGNYQYVYYFGAYPTDSQTHIHQLLYNNVGWGDRDLTAASGAKVSPVGKIIAFTTSPALHVYYEGSDYHIHQLFSNSGATWQDQDLSALTGQSLPNYIGLEAGFNIGNLQYLYWQDANGHTHQLSYNNSNWSDTDITAFTWVPTFGVSAAFVLPGTQQIRLYAVQTGNLHILQFASPNNGKWTVTDLTQASNAPKVSSFQMVAFATTPNNQVHVYFTSGTSSTNRQVSQIFQAAPTTWVSENLTSLGNGSPIQPLNADGEMAFSGFSIQNYQYLFYSVK